MGEDAYDGSERDFTRYRWASYCPCGKYPALITWQCILELNVKRIG